MHPLAWAAVALATFVAMEGVAWLAHRYVMHGFGWGWHRSHHAPRHGRLERNDWYAVLGVAAAVGLFLLAGRLQSPALQAIATGITAYGLVYSLVHDGLVHQRWPLRWTPRGGYLQRLVQAHRLHHAVRTREGAVAFGFLIVPAPRRLAAQLRARRQGEAHEARARGTHAA